MGLAQGTRLGSYEIVSAIGAGGMGEVYRARDTKLGREVALKVLPEAFAADAERLARFEREAKVLASLNHPNIAAIYGFEDSGSASSGLRGGQFHALVMELVDGPTLAERIAGAAGPSSKGSVGYLSASAEPGVKSSPGAAKPIPLEEALPIARQICEALEYAHERGIVHRDLKPANVKITPEGTVKLLDFGLAKALEGEIAAGDVSTSPTISRMATQAGIILGTAAYMAPEQAKGKAVDRRADIWAFGCVLFEMLSGRRTFDGETVSDLLAAVIKSEPDWGLVPADTPHAIRHLLRRCLKKDPKQRLQAIGDARIAIEETISSADGEISAVPSVTLPAEATSPGWRRLLPWAIASVLAVALGVSVSILRRPSTPVPQPIVRAAIPVATNLGITSLALSPDGSRLAYVGFQNVGSNLLGWRDLSQRETTDLPNVKAPSYPFFSPNGQWLGVFSADKLVKIDLSTGIPQDICDAARAGGGSWGDNGTIVFSDAAGLFAVSAAGGQPRLLQTTASGDYFSFPQILPDGHAAIVSQLTRDGRFSVVLVRLEGSSTAKPAVVLDNAVDAQFLPQGQLIFDRRGSLYAARFDLKNLRVIGSAVDLHIPVAGINERGWANYAVARNGTLAYAVAGEEYSNNDLVWVDRKGAAQPLPAPEQRYSDPQISPDGHRLVVGVGGVGNASQNLWIYGFDRQVLTRLTFGNKLDFAPVWTPNGKHIVFVSPGTKWRLFSVPTDGSGPEKEILTFPSATFPTSFSPDGLALALDLWNGKHDEIDILHFRDADATQPAGPPTVFLADQFDNDRPEFSPDGRWIAFESNQSGSPQIYVRPYPGPGGQVQISTDGGNQPRWSGDGRQIFYENGDKMMTVAVATKPTFTVGRPQVVFQGDYMSPGAVLNYAVAPDGAKLLMERRGAKTASPEIDVLVNWGGELQKLMRQAKE